MNKDGRPLKFKSPEEMEKLIDAYMDKTDIEELTLTGLCIALDTQKVTLNDYEKKPEFRHIIKMAKLHIENAYELSLRKHGRSGDIFALKNFGWKDKQEIEQTNIDPIKVTITPVKPI